ncbi:MAG: Fe-S cluster domain-containing protein [Candidatus Omnitrophica bacterium]|nr:Fe-S cluster domain-containing protein [Candidatus Omnitrophota bacterium]
MISQFLAPILTLAGLGLFFGLVLSWAAHKFAVVSDPRIQEVLARLPGANCGACGLPGCSGFAEAIVKDRIAIGKCKACSQEAACEIANILGIKLTAKEEQVASLRCHGGKRAKDKFIYQGIKDCPSAAQTLGGPKLCRYACLGFGNCARACPFGAITMSPEGLPIIDSQLCTACGKCIEVCPRNLLVLLPRKGEVYVGCSSHHPAKIVASVCSVGCIACKKCDQVCPDQAIKVVENLAVIDYDKCTACGKCIEVCPRKIIFWRK